MKQFLKLYLCSLCNKEYPNNVESCTLEHCKFCGETSLEMITPKIIRDPIFILINTLFALLAVYVFFNKDDDNIGMLFMFGVFLYAMGLGIFLGATDRRSLYYCKNCRTTFRTPLTKVTVGEYETKPEKKEIIQSMVVPKTHRAKEIIVILGSIGSVAGLIFILITLND